ncbi:MAG TPA: exodeoxyribonuclease VII large subunit [Acidobacteriota bacterium]|jgi:exodeoxyribonuclease VII large subunit|nr:exodeoxyribonuclease VII large subunit [Acidobacteriota bacterium]HJO29913.1 exodeoxyribonuclease VII large subunit [Acidobacteriota bacterium]|tara:strand:+ start:3002 stop:4378 length:1377 start_codon:yes stop_codon:yes gene_type:complete
MPLEVNNNLRQVWSVSDLVDLSRDLLAKAMPFVWVRGEISGFSSPVSGHWYFDLKDDRALVSVAMFKAANSQIPFEIKDGMEIILGGEVAIYPRRGKFQIVAEILEPVGWGALQIAYEQLKTRLDSEGLFDSVRKRPLPILPRCIGVVTSPTGAAWRDMCQVWRKNSVPIRALLSPTQVQGTDAATGIVSALDRLNRHGKANVIIVGRGGGSREDLWAFNEEPVARAIAASDIPVVAAVGHEIDQTIADLVADHRAATPTAAAELVAYSRQRLMERIVGTNIRTRTAVTNRILTTRSRLQESILQQTLVQPSRLLVVYRQRLDEAFARVKSAIDRQFNNDRQTLQATIHRIAPKNLIPTTLKTRGRVNNAASTSVSLIRRQMAQQKSRFAATVARLSALSPLDVLGRGYSICERATDGSIVREADDVTAGDSIRVRLQKDTLECTVQSTKQGTPPQPL